MVGHDVPSTSLNTTAQIATASSSWWVGPRGMSLNPALDVAGSLRLIPALAMWHYKIGHRYYRIGHPALSNVSPTPMVQWEVSERLWCSRKIAVTSSTAWHKRSDPTTVADISSPHMTSGW